VSRERARLRGKLAEGDFPKGEPHRIPRPCFRVIMVGMKTHCRKFIRAIFCAALSGIFTGCIGYSDAPRHHGSYAQPPPAYVQTEIVVQDDYIYYPDYQVYYSANRHQYIYLEGRSWVTRPTPPRVSAEVLVSAPSVRLAFHVSPASHHATVVRQYPKHWAPPGQTKEKHENHGNDQQENR